MRSPTASQATDRVVYRSTDFFSLSSARPISANITQYQHQAAINKHKNQHVMHPNQVLRSGSVATQQAKQASKQTFKNYLC